MRIGHPTALIAEAEHAGAGKAIWAVVARPRSDFLTIDIDKCADQVFRPILEASEQVGAAVAHLAASGSPDSLHLAFTCPSPAARTFLQQQIEGIRDWAHLENDQAVDIFSARRVLRLPGSISLKGGHYCRPVDEMGRTITAVEAVKRAKAAEQVAVAPQSLKVDDKLSAPNDHRTTSRVIVDPARTEAVEPAEEAPRAWRRRKRLSDQEWRLMMSTPVAPYRSDAALKAAWVLWRNGVRSWAQAKWWYTNCPVFIKFAERDTRRPPELRAGPGECQKHWQALAARARSHRPPLSDSELALVGQVRQGIAEWAGDPDLAIAALAVIEHRFTDGHGLENRPISVRCLALWLNVHIDRAAQIRAALVNRGVLRETRPHSQGSAREATLFSLALPSQLYRSSSSHDVTAPLPLNTGQPLCPTWSVLGYTAWLLYCHLTATPTPLSSLAAPHGVRPGTSRYGGGRALHLLERHGLARRIGAGRGTKWVRGNATPASAAQGCGALTRLKALRIHINAERSAWHAESRSEQVKTLWRLRQLRGSRHKSAAAQLDLESLGSWSVVVRDETAVQTRTRQSRPKRSRHRGRVGPPPRAG